MPSFNRHQLHGAVEQRRAIENRYAQENRAKKVRAYVAIVDLSFLSSGLNPDRHAQRIAEWLEARDAAWWGKLAEQNALNVAHELTREAIIAEYNARARAVLWLSTLGLDSWSSERVEELRRQVANEIETAPPGAEWVATHRQAERLLRHELKARVARAA
jgi:hypothetical protein